MEIHFVFCVCVVRPNSSVMFVIDVHVHLIADAACLPAYVIVLHIHVCLSVLLVLYSHHFSVVTMYPILLLLPY